MGTRPDAVALQACELERKSTSVVIASPSPRRTRRTLKVSATNASETKMPVTLMTKAKSCSSFMPSMTPTRVRSLWTLTAMRAT